MLGHASQDAGSDMDQNNHSAECYAGSFQVATPASSSSQNHRSHVLDNNFANTKFSIRRLYFRLFQVGMTFKFPALLNVLATLLQTKELDESIVDALGILPQRKQHKKKLLQALVGEEQLFSSEPSAAKDGFSSDLDIYLQKLQEYVVISCPGPEVGVSPRVHRFQVLNSLVNLFCRSNISAETLWDAGWLLRQLLPYSEAEFNSHHLRLLKPSSGHAEIETRSFLKDFSKYSERLLYDCTYTHAPDSFHHCTDHVLEEARGTWSDLLLTVICDEWRKCKRVIDAASPRKDPKCMLLPPYKSASDEHASCESSFTAGERMCETVKVFALLHHLHTFSHGRVLPDQPPVSPAVDIPEKSRAKNAGLSLPEVKPNTEINMVDAVHCRIAFERGKERHFHLVALSIGSCGWLVLAEELPMKPRRGVVRVVAPLAGCNPRIDDKHSRWLHLRIRPSSLPFMDTAKYTAHGKVKSKGLVDGRWTLAFRYEESCKYALSMILEEIKLQSHLVERSLQPLLELDRSLDTSSPS